MLKEENIQNFQLLTCKTGYISSFLQILHLSYPGKILILNSGFSCDKSYILCSLKWFNTTFFHFTVALVENLAPKVFFVKVPLSSTGPQLQNLGLSPYLIIINLERGQHEFRTDKKPTPCLHGMQKNNSVKSYQRWILNGVRSSNGKICVQWTNRHSQKSSHMLENKIKKRKPLKINTTQVTPTI